MFFELRKIIIMIFYKFKGKEINDNYSRKQYPEQI